MSPIADSVTFAAGTVIAVAGAAYTYFSDSSSSTSHDNPWREEDPSRKPTRPKMQQRTGTTFTEDRRAELKQIADETLKALRIGFYPYKGIDQFLSKEIQEAREKTKYYGPNSSIVSWASGKGRARRTGAPAHVSVLQISTLDAARLLENVYRNANQRELTGVLNFASATLPGGGFKNGADAQEESIARSSTLYPTLQTSEASKFYKLHEKEQQKQHEHSFYTHAIIYSPGVTVFRDDDGVWTYPFPIDVLSCAAVNAGEVRKTSQGPVISGLEVEIEKEMNERMGRILYVFEQNNVRNLVLGTFGTGVFRNKIALVARLWAHLLVVPGARFEYSFDRIIFAITGEETFAEFQGAFDAWSQSRPTGVPKRGSNSEFEF